MTGGMNPIVGVTTGVELRRVPMEVAAMRGGTGPCKMPRPGAMIPSLRAGRGSGPMILSLHAGRGSGPMILILRTGRGSGTMILILCAGRGSPRVM